MKKPPNKCQSVFPLAADWQRLDVQMRKPRPFTTLRHNPSTQALSAAIRSPVVRVEAYLHMGSVLIADLQEVTAWGLLWTHTAHLHTFSLENQQQTCPSFPSTARQDRLTFSFQILFTTQRSPRKQSLGGLGEEEVVTLPWPSLFLPLQWVPCSIPALSHSHWTGKSSVQYHLLQGPCLLLLDILSLSPAPSSEWEAYRESAHQPSVMNGWNITGCLVLSLHNTHGPPGPSSIECMVGHTSLHQAKAWMFHSHLFLP